MDDGFFYSLVLHYIDSLPSWSYPCLSLVLTPVLRIYHWELIPLLHLQIPSNNVQLLLAPISTPPVIQRVQQTSSVGLVNLSNQAPIATADQYMCEPSATQPTQPSQMAASQPITSIGSSQVSVAIVIAFGLVRHHSAIAYC